MARTLTVLCVALLSIAIVAASDVLTLTSENFDQTLQENPLVLVEFYAPWCGHCKQLAPLYEETATLAKQQGIAVKLASVDADSELNAPLRERYEIRGFPTLKFFRNGEPTEYDGDRTTQGLLSFIKRQSQPASTPLTTVDQATAFAQSEKVVVIGFFDNAESAEYNQFKALANQLRNTHTFGEVVGNADINKALEVEKTPAVVLFKQFDDKRVQLDSFDNLLSFVKTQSVPLIDEIGPHNFKSYLDSGLPLAYLFTDLTVEGQLNEYLEHVKDLATATKGKLNWVYIDWAKYAKHAERLGLSGKTVPAIAIELMAEGTHYVFDELKAITKTDVTSWVNSFLAGEIQPTVKSEPVPATNDEDVKIVVANSFNEIVNDANKDVFVEFYAPWCGHCKKLAPVFDELGAAFKNDAHVTIAKIDATANDISPKFGVRGFPTLKFFPAKAKDTPINYEGDRSLEDMKTFIKTHSSFAGRDEL